MYVSVGSIRKRCNCLENDWRYNSEMNKKIFGIFFCCFLFYPPFCVLSILLSEVSPLRYTTTSMPYHALPHHTIPIVLPCPLVLDFRWCFGLAHINCMCVVLCSVWYSCTYVQYTSCSCSLCIYYFGVFVNKNNIHRKAAAPALAESSSRANQPPSNERTV